jgi:hypothetical protein
MTFLSFRNKPPAAGFRCYGWASMIVFIVLSIVLSVVATAAPIPEHIADKWGDRGNWPVPPVPDDISAYHPPSERTMYYQSLRSGPAGHMLILVESGLFTDIDQDIESYILLLENDGWAIELVSWSGTSPIDLKLFLQNRHAAGMTGAWFIGDLPVAWCRLPEDFGNDTFPADIYFMDLNGEWQDTNRDGVFDVQPDRVAPVIWIGRLNASNLTVTGHSETVLVRDYLDKAASYRIDPPDDPLPPAVCTDFDFSADSYQGASAVTWLFGASDRTVTPDPDVYTVQIKQERPWMSVYVHGSPEAHYFPNGLVTATSLPDMGIHTRFFASFSCSNSRYTEQDNMGSWYVFSEHSPLGLVGSTKTGSLYYVNTLVEPLARGQSFGDALLHWSARHSHQNPPWFFGVTLLGDPSLPVLRKPCIADYHVTDMDGNDALPTPGSTVQIWIDITNATGWTLTDDTTIELISNTADVTILDAGPFSPDALAPGTTGTVGPFVIGIADDLPDGYTPELFADISRQQRLWRRPFHVPIAAPAPRPGHPFVDTAAGHAIPGEYAPVYFPVTNYGAADMTDEPFRIESHNPWLMLPEYEFFSLSIAAGETEWFGPVQLHLDGACPVGDILPLEFVWLNGYPADTVTLVAGGGLLFNPDAGWNGLSHAPATPHTFDQWRRTPDYFHCGRPDGLPYKSGMDAALNLPDILVTGPAWLEIEHEMQGEGSSGDRAYDGGRVEIDTGDGFVPLIPGGGYTHRFEIGNTAEYMSPCWADVPRGTIHQFELNPDQSAQTIRFRFVSDGGLAYEGWKIQSIRITGNAVIPGPHSPPSCDHTGVRLFLPADEFRPGDICRLNAHICNADPDILTDVPVFFLLEVDGQFWFWPSWSELDYQLMNLSSGITGLTVIEPFIWPSGAGSYEPIYFYGALLNESMTSILGDWDSVSFSFME